VWPIASTVPLFDEAISTPGLGKGLVEKLAAAYSSGMDKAFVSSTCFDLLDLRRELYEYVREIGLTPVMSDEATSDFEVDLRADSISSCLANVRAADVVVVVLSQRYGPRLGKYGFENVSATHLEYKTAVAAKKPICVFARDRLVGLHDEFRRHGKHALQRGAWVQDEKDIGLFELLDEHKKLVEGDRNNWFDPFTSSVDLKVLLSARLRAWSSRSRILRMREAGELPTFTFMASSERPTETTFEIFPHGPRVLEAIEETPGKGEPRLPTLALGNKADTTISLPEIGPNLKGVRIALRVQLRSGEWVRFIYDVLRRGAQQARARLVAIQPADGEQVLVLAPGEEPPSLGA
jgi:hypothetical protein